jgi:hypothetical protein
LPTRAGGRCEPRRDYRTGFDTWEIPFAESGRDGTFGSICLTEDPDTNRLVQLLEEIGLDGRGEIELAEQRLPFLELMRYALEHGIE